MQLLGWEELSEEQRAQAVLIDWSDWGPPSLGEALHAPWVRGRPYQEYSSLVAVERRRVVARVGRIRLEFRSREGTERVLGISDVITDPRELRRGLARTLVTEAHERARSEGISKAFLGTRRSWGAHGGYEKLGYADVFSSPLALRAIPRASSPRPGRRYRLRRGRRSDAGTFQAILDSASADRLGFLPRSPRWFEARLRLRWNQPKDFLLLRKDDQPLGYALTWTSRRQVTCTEAIPVRPQLGGVLLDAIEGYAAGKWLAFAITTFLRDSASEFQGREYVRSDRSHSVVMMASLRGSASSELRQVRGVFEDPALFLHHPDTF